MNIQSILDRHNKIALQFSGGKDSLACLYLLKDYWKYITVYFLNTGDMFPSTLEVIDRVKREVPYFVEIKGKVQQSISMFGIPSDVVPATSTGLAKAIDVNSDMFKVTDRYTCCSHSIMLPMHQKMLDDGITLIIRGQKNSDSHKPNIQSGQVHDGVEYLFPLELWTDDEVFVFLLTQDQELPSHYQKFQSSGDCMTCSAWLGEGRGKYLSENHPVQFSIYQARLSMISKAMSPHIENLSKELL